MKQFLASAAMAAVASAGASSQCLKCRNEDKNSGFLVSFSYCKFTNTCLEDAWNYLNRGCPDGWKTGISYDFELCEADFSECASFTSSPDEYQR